MVSLRYRNKGSVWGEVTDPIGSGPALIRQSGIIAAPGRARLPDVHATLGVKAAILDPSAESELLAERGTIPRASVEAGSAPATCSNLAAAESCCSTFVAAEADT